MGSKQESLLGGSRFHEGDFVFLQTGIMGQKGKTFYFCLGDEHSAKGVSVMWRKVFHSMRMLDGDMKHFKGLTFQNALEIPGNFQKCSLTRSDQKVNVLIFSPFKDITFRYFKIECRAEPSF